MRNVMKGHGHNSSGDEGSHGYHREHHNAINESDIEQHRKMLQEPLLTKQ